MTHLQRLPDFFIVGAAKSGTTSLYHYLTQHPSIYMPRVKEPNFLAYRDRPLNLHGPVNRQRIREVIYADSVTAEPDYLALFDAALPQQRVGEASPRYLYYANAVANLASIAPTAKLIVLLRDPVLRAHSHYRMNLEFNLEPCRHFEEALALEQERTAKGYGWDWHYRGVSRYGEQIARLLQYFPRSQIHICTYERFSADPLPVCREICEFLGIDANIDFDVEQRYKVSQPGSGWLGALVNHTDLSATGRLAKALLPAPIGRVLKAGLRVLAERGQHNHNLRPATYRALKRQFRDDIERLGALTGIDLSAWDANDTRYAEPVADTAAKIVASPATR